MPGAVTGRTDTPLPDLEAVRAELLEALTAAAVLRPQRRRVVTTQFCEEQEFEVLERQTLLTLVNGHRGRRGLPPVEELDVFWAEQDAAMSDGVFEQVYAARCAALVFAEPR